MNVYLEALQTWGHASANNAGWPEFEGKFINYLQFKKEWWAYRRTYHEIVLDSLVAKSL
jgi:hypothetical protein